MLKLIQNQTHLCNKWLLRARLSFPWSAIVKDSNAMVNALARVVLIVVGERKKTWYLALGSFCKRSNQIVTKQGLPGLVQYLKVSQMMLQSAIANPSRKLPGKVFGPGVAKTRTGYPRIIPKVHRKLIRQGSEIHIQFWLTLFSLYRVLELKPRYKLFTISKGGVPESALEASGILAGVSEFKRSLFSRGRAILPNSVRNPTWVFEPLPILCKITPNTLKDEISFFNLIRDAVAWVNHPLLPLLKVFVDEVEACRPWSDGKVATDGSYRRALDLLLEIGNSVKLFDIGGRRIRALVAEKLGRIQRKHEKNGNLLKQTLNAAKFYEVLDSLKSPGFEPLNYVKSFDAKISTLIEQLDKNLKELPTRGILGRLGCKPEPSGKVRVFAMVDWWTQCFMGPIHRWLFQILRSIKQDGTFDHSEAVRYLQDYIKERKVKEVYSYDLSAATDRLPVILQVHLLGEFIGKRLATLWAALLVGRGYKVPNKALRYTPRPGLHRIPALFHSSTYYRNVMDYGSKSDIQRLFNSEELTKGFIFYKVGAPMGCLSNWAMLALTHHYLVQFAAKQAGYKGLWFPGYVILGDDIVIADKEVAVHYRQLMVDIGVPINTHKSLVSTNGSFEFAKQFVYGPSSTNCSPFSISEITVARQSLSGLLLLLSKERRMVPLKLKTVISFLFGYKALAHMGESFHKMIAHRRYRLMRTLAFLMMPNTSPWSKETYADWLKATSITSVGTWRLEPTFQVLVNKIIIPFVKDWKDEKIIDYSKVFPAKFKAERLFKQATFDLINKWDNNKAEALGRLLSLQLDPQEVNFEEAFRSFIDVLSDLNSFPRNLCWESLKTERWKPPVGRWMRNWLYLWSAAHRPNWSHRYQHHLSRKLPSSIRNLEALVRLHEESNIRFPIRQRVELPPRHLSHRVPGVRKSGGPPSRNSN